MRKNYGWTWNPTHTASTWMMSSRRVMRDERALSLMKRFLDPSLAMDLVPSARSSAALETSSDIIEQRGGDEVRTNNQTIRTTVILLVLCFGLLVSVPEVPHSVTANEEEKHLCGNL
jgi:hypothetical protein